MVRAVGPVRRGGAHRASTAPAREAGAASIPLPAVSTGIQGRAAVEATRIAVSARFGAATHQKELAA
ncbi:MAG: hypothetical protein ICV73_06340 [Acetobacteraceae bacterium]|nr:hypothetical protein [Acetobacteraceae bacterium]